MRGKKLLAEIKDAISYDPSSGIFRWRITRRSYAAKVRPGVEAGTRKRPDKYIRIAFTDSDGKRHLYLAHRLAWWFQTGRMPKEIDHQDRVRSNNAWRNLREATRTQNNLNTKLRVGNVSGKTGVSWDSTADRWLARLKINGRVIHLGYFRSVPAATVARREAELKYLGRHCPS